MVRYANVAGQRSASRAVTDLFTPVNGIGWEKSAAFRLITTGGITESWPEATEKTCQPCFSVALRHLISPSMKSSISPSRTAFVFDVSTSVRRSLTIWYGWST